MSKTQGNLACVEYVLLLSEFHDVETETNMSCKEGLINSVHLHSTEERNTILIFIWIE